MGVTTMKMMSNTSTTSTNGVTLMSAFRAPLLCFLPPRRCFLIFCCLWLVTIQAISDGGDRTGGWLPALGRLGRHAHLAGTAGGCAGESPALTGHAVEHLAG